MKKTFWKIAQLISITYGCLLSVSVFAIDKPNVIFILADDLGYGDLGCYGNRIIKTPHIDKLANEGVRFSDCYAGASVSSPSRSCLMTGLHTGHTRIRGNMCRVGGIEGTREGMKGTVRRTNLQPQDSTIANVLSNNGYVTCLVNKWHLDGFNPQAGPLDRGFQEFYGWLIREPQSHNFYPTIRYRNREEYTITDNLNDKKIDHNTDRSTIEAIDFIQRNQEKPFFLYLAYNSPHVPLDAKSWGDYKDTNLSDNDKSYAANTETLTLNGNLRGWKGELYEGGIRVPLIVKMPNKMNAGQVSNFPCYFPDMLTTFSDMTNSHTTITTDGVSILPEIKNPNSLSADSRFLYWEQFPSKGISQAVRWDNWKLIRQNIGKSFELYNLRNDESETKNVATQFPDIVNKLAEYMQSSHVESENWPVN